MDRLVLRAVAGRSVVRHELSVKPVHISQGLHCQCGIPDPQGVSPFLLIERGRSEGAILTKGPFV